MIYSWQARSSAGDLRTGTLEAATPQAAADALSSSGLVPVRIEAVGAGAQQKEKLSLWKRLSSVGTVSLRRKALFYRQFAAVVEAGISLDSALSDLAEGETYRPLSCRIEAVRRHVAAGEALHAALAAGHPAVWANRWLCWRRTANGKNGCADVSSRPWSIPDLCSVFPGLW